MVKVLNCLLEVFAVADAGTVAEVIGVGVVGVALLTMAEEVVVASGVAADGVTV